MIALRSIANRRPPSPKFRRCRTERLLHADWSTLYAAADRVIVRYGEDSWALGLNLRNGRLLPMTPLMGAVWWMLEEQGGLDLESAVLATAQGTGQSLDDLREQVQRQVPKLIRWRALSNRYRTPRPGVVRLAPTGPASRCEQRTTAVEPGTPSPAGSRAAAVLAFYAAVALRMHRPYMSWITGPSRRRPRTRRPVSDKGERSTIIPLWLILRILTAVCRLRTQRPTVESTHRAIAIVRRVARRHIGWADCFEITIGALLLLAFRGQAPTLCIGGVPGRGVRHAWLVCDDLAIDHVEQRTQGLAILAIVAVNQPPKQGPEVM